MHQAYMLQALGLAQQRRGFCAPNPSVGAVILRDNNVIAQGFHQGPGHAHAEVAALAQASGALTQATLYVTLEPCSHTGRTPPCVDAIINAGIKHVVYGFIDPNPLVAGQGIARLQAAGVMCEPCLLAEVAEFYQAYAYWWQTQQSWLTAKLAISLTGQTGGQITGSVAQQFTHQQRRYSDAILTTASTVNSDDPQFNVRLAETVQAKPVIVLDTQGQLAAKRQIQATAAAITVLHGEDHDAPAGYSGVALPEANGHVDPVAVKKWLGAQGYHRVWLEAGARAFTAFLQAGVLNDVYVYVAPKIVAGKTSVGLQEAFDLSTQAEHIEWQVLGNDACCYCRF